MTALLAEKYRPYTFADVVGQQQAVATLAGRVTSPRGTFLLSGPYGSGKTTLARIFARVINCRDVKTCTRENPCVSCEAFDGITKGGQHPNIVEVNGADTKGIDDVRNLIQMSKYSPTGGGYRVFIIDEIHQLTTQAQDALLKGFEEPTKSTVWMMATNYPEKIKPALTSRAIKAPITLLTAPEVRVLIDRVCAQEGIQIPQEVSASISEACGGHPRDALNLVQSYASAAASGVTVDIQQWVRRAEAGSPTFLAFKYIEGVFKKNAVLAMTIPAQVEYQQRFLEDVIDILQGLVYQSLGAADLVNTHRYGEKIRKVPLTTNDLPLLAKLLDMHTRGLIEMKSYAVADTVYVNALAARAFLA